MEEAPEAAGRGTVDEADGLAGAVGPGISGAVSEPAFSNIWSNLALCWAGVSFSFSPPALAVLSRSLLADLGRLGHAMVQAVSVPGSLYEFAGCAHLAARALLALHGGRTDVAATAKLPLLRYIPVFLHSILEFTQ